MVKIFFKPNLCSSFLQNYCLRQLLILFDFKQILKALQVFLACILIFGCTPKQKYKFYKADAPMYVEYIGYLKLLEKGEKAVIGRFGSDRQVNYYFRDFREEGIRVLLIKDKRTNQQYFVFYSDVLSTKRAANIQNASAVSGLSVNKALFNRDILNTYFKIEEIIEFRFEKNVKKILIGNEVGGAIANMFAASLISNTNFKEQEFEVVTFGMPDFSRNFKLNFDSKNFALKEDANVDLAVKCCVNDDIKRIMLPSAQTGTLTKTDVLEAYSNALKKL